MGIRFFFFEVWVEHAHNSDSPAGSCLHLQIIRQRNQAPSVLSIIPKNTEQKSSVIQSLWKLLHTVCTVGTADSSNPTIPPGRLSKFLVQRAALGCPTAPSPETSEHMHDF